MNRSNTVFTVAISSVALAVATAGPAFAGTATGSSTRMLATEISVKGCFTPSQLSAAATTVMTNLSKDLRLGARAKPAGLRVNGVWYPAGILKTGSARVSVASCPRTETLGIATIGAPNPAIPSSSQLVLKGCLSSLELQSAATAAMANWSKEARSGPTLPAGVRVNGVWYPAILLLSGPPQSALTCGNPGALAG